MAWRDIAAPIIAKVILENKGKPEIEIKRAISKVYPFGERRYHPYKVWLDEIKVQLGKKKRGVKITPTPDNQIDIFNGK